MTTPDRPTLDRLSDCTEATIQACGAISYMSHVLDGLQTRLQMISRSATGFDNDFGLAESVNVAERVLKLVDEAMQLLGNHLDEPGEDDVKATKAAFRRCRKVLRD